MSKEYKAVKNYIHNELKLTKEDIINAIRSDIRQGNYIPVYTSLPITITNNHKLYKYYIC